MDHNGTVGCSYLAGNHVSPCCWSQAGLSQARNALGQVYFWLGKYDLWVLRDDALRRGDRVGIDQHVSTLGCHTILAIAWGNSVRKNLDRSRNQLLGDVVGVREQHCREYFTK